MVIAFFLDSFVQVIKFSFQGFKKMVYFSGIDLVRMILLSIIILIGLKLNHGILSPVIAYIIVPIILIIIFGSLLVKRVFKKFFESKFVFEKKLIKNISRYSIFVMATTGGGTILWYTDTLVLTYFAGLTSVALYSVALPTAKVFLYFPRAIGGMLLPLTSEFWVQNKKFLIKDGLQLLYKYSVIIIVPLVFAVFSFSEFLIQILFGSSYIEAANALKILSIGMIFATLNVTSINFFSGIGKPEINSKIIYTAAIFNLITNLILIPIYGIIGAAITTTISYFIMMVMGLINTRKFINVKFPILLWTKTLIAGLIFVFVIFLMKKILVFNLFLEAVVILILSGIAYILLLFLFKIINIDEIKDLYKKVK